jgi:hypothetical protein
MLPSVRQNMKGKAGHTLGVQKSACHQTSKKQNQSTCTSVKQGKREVSSRPLQAKEHKVIRKGERYFIGTNAVRQQGERQRREEEQSQKPATAL